MDKREEDAVNGILDEDEDENELPVIPESLKGETPEAPEQNPDAPPDLTDFLDENTEAGNWPSIDPKLDEALSKFSDDESDGSEPEKENKKTRAEIEKEIREKIARENRKNSKLVRNIFIICIAAVILIGGGIFAFLQIGKMQNNYIMTFENKKISVEDLKFFLILNVLNQTAYDTQSAYGGLVDFLVLDKAAKDKNIELTDEEKEYVKSEAEFIKNYFTANNIKMPNISDERLEDFVRVSFTGTIYYKLLDMIAEETNFFVEETVLAAEFENYKATDKLVKYIVTDTQEAGEEVCNEISSGAISPDNAIIQYSTYYDASYGIDKINLSGLGLAEEQNANVMALQPSGFSEVIDYGGIFLILIPASDAETEETFRENYIAAQKNELFYAEYDLWSSEAKIEPNNVLLDSFDVDAFFNETFPQ